MILIAHPRVGALAVVLAVASLGGVACGSSPPPEPAIAARHRAVLRSLGEHVILPQYRAFADAASALDAATLAYANAPSDETRSAAQAAWEPAEVMLIGAGRHERERHGRGRRHGSA